MFDQFDTAFFMQALRHNPGLIQANVRLAREDEEFMALWYQMTLHAPEMRSDQIAMIQAHLDFERLNPGPEDDDDDSWELA